MISRFAAPLWRAVVALGLGTLALSALAEGEFSAPGTTAVKPVFVNTEGPFRSIPQVPRIFMPPNPKDPPKFEQPEELGYSNPFLVVEAPGLMSVQAPPVREGWDAIGPNGLAPPDPVVGVGPSNVLVATNDDFAIYAPDGQLQQRWDINDFIGSNDFFFDPRVAFDHQSQRWLLVYLRRRDSSSQSWWTLIVSDDADFRGNTWHYSFDARLDGSTDVNQWVDFPYIGYDNEAIVLSGRMFNWGGGGRYSKTRFLRKSDVYSAATAGWWDIWNWQSDGSADNYVVPAEMQTNPGVLFMLTTKAGGSDTLTFRQMSNTAFSGGGPVTDTTRVLTVAAYTAPPDAAQPEGVQALDTVDARLNNAQYRLGKLWAAHSTSVGSGATLRSAIQFYEVDTYASPVAIGRQSSLSGADSAYFYPAIAGNEDGDAFITFMQSSSSIYPTMRMVGWPAGAGTDGSVAVRSGNDSSLQLDSIGRNRWGDYAQAALDPVDDESVWMVNMYGNATRSWGTHVIQSNYDKIQTSIVAANVVGELGQTVNLTATVRRIDTNALLASAPVVFYLDNVEIGTANTNASGVASFAYAIPLGSTLGSKTVRASYWRTNAFDGATDTSTLTVNKIATTLTALDSTGIVGEPDTLFATLRRARDGVTISSEPVRFTVDGLFLGVANTAGNGQATYNWAAVNSATLGIRTWTANYQGDVTYLASSDTANYTRRRRTNLTTNDVMGEDGFAVPITARLRRDDGAIPTGRPVRISVDGVVAGTLNTDANGDVSLNYNIPLAFNPGDNKPILVEFLGEDGLVASSDTATLRVRFRTNLAIENTAGAVGQVVNLRATLRRTTGNVALATRTIAFNVDGTAAGNADTNLAGLATRSWAVNAGTLGARPSNATWAGDATTMPAVSNGTFTREAAKSLTLRVVLGDWTVAPTGQIVNVVIRQSGTTVYSANHVLNASGNVTFSAPVLAGASTISVKGSHWLRRRQSVNITTSTPTVNFSLINGDVDNDNVVTVFDYDILSEYFDRTSAQPGWTTIGGSGFAPRDADLDGDGAVTVFDYDILSSNFDVEGDPI